MRLSKGRGNRALLFKISSIALIIMILLSFTLFSCGDSKLSAEIVGRWSYSFPPGLEDVPNFEYEPECGLIDAYPLTSAEIDGKKYLIMGFPPHSSRDSTCYFIFDTEDPFSPRLISTIKPEEQGKHGVIADSCAVSGDILYSFLFLEKGLWLVDISDPANPVDLGIVPIEATQNLTVVEGIAYASGQMYNGITIVDVSDMQNIREISRIDLPTREHCLAVNGEYLYVGIKQTVTIFDISNPVFPEAIGTCELEVPVGLVTELPFYTGEIHWGNWASIIDMQASGDYVYVTFGAGQVRIIDVSNPSFPQEVARVDLNGFAIALTLKDDYLYVTKSDVDSQMLQLAIIDITESSNPKLIHSVITESIFGFGGSSYAYCWARPQVIGDYVYVAGINYMDVVKFK